MSAGRLIYQLAGVDRGQLAVTLEDAAVDQDRVDVRRYWRSELDCCTR